MVNLSEERGSHIYPFAILPSLLLSLSILSGKAGFNLSLQFRGEFGCVVAKLPVSAHTESGEAAGLPYVKAPVKILLQQTGFLPDVSAKPSWMIQGYKTTSLCHPSPFCLHLSHAISLSFPCLRHSSCPTFNHNILLLQVHILLGSQGCNILGNIFQELVAALAGSCISCAQSLLTAQHCCLLFFLSLCRFFPGHWDFNFPSVVMTGSLLS